MDALEKYPSNILLIGLFIIFLMLHLYLSKSVSIDTGSRNPVPARQKLQIRLNPPTIKKANPGKLEKSKREQKVLKTERRKRSFPVLNPKKLEISQKNRVERKLKNPAIAVIRQETKLFAKAADQKDRVIKSRVNAESIVTPKSEKTLAEDVRKEPVKIRDEPVERVKKQPAFKTKPDQTLVKKTPVLKEEEKSLALTQDQVESTNKAVRLSGNLIPTPVKPVVNWNQLVKQFISEVDVSDYYPALSRRRRQQGVVVLNLVLEGNMEVTGIFIKRKSKYPRLDKAALVLMKENKKSLEKILGLKSVSLKNPVSLYLPVHFALR